MTLATELQLLCRDGDLITAKALLDAAPEELALAQQQPTEPAARMILDHASYLRGWTTLQLRLGRIVGSGPAPVTRDTPDLLLVSHDDAALAAWVGTGARITRLTVSPFRTELDEPEPAADLTDALGLPLDRYVDLAIEAIIAQAIALGAPLIVVQGRPWLAVAASAAAHRLGLPLWWDLRSDNAALTQIIAGQPFTAAVPSPLADAAFRAAASAARLVVGSEQMAPLQSVRELRDRLLAIGPGPHGSTPAFPSVWAAWRAATAGLVPAAPRHHFVGRLRAASSVPTIPRLALIGHFEGFPHPDLVPDPPEILPEEVDGVVIDARTAEAWAQARDRAIQARTYHLPIVAIGLPDPAERPFADIIATVGPVPREARTSGHQPQWGFVAVSDNPTGYRMALRAAALQIGAPAFAPRSASPRPVGVGAFTAPGAQLTVLIRPTSDDAQLQATLAGLRRQSLHPSLFTLATLHPGEDTPPDGGRTVVVTAGQDLPAGFLLTRWLSAPIAVV